MAFPQEYSGHLNAYKAACEEHPELKSFDSSLQQRTNKVVNSITAQAENGSLSFHASHIEVYGCLLEVDQAVAKFITESKADVWENEDLRSLVKAYFENTTKTLEFFNTVENVVNKAEMGQLIIQSAVGQFDKDSVKTGNCKSKYRKTLEELKKFKGMKQDFDGKKFKTQFELVKKEQVSLLEQVSNLKKKLDEEYSRIETYEKVSNMVFGAVLASVAVLAAATLAFGGTLVIGALTISEAGVAGLSSLPLIELGWEETSNALKKMEETLKRQKEISVSVDKSLEVNEDAMSTVYLSVNDLITKISLISDTVDFATATKEDVDMKHSLHLIKKNVEEFTQKINDAGENVTKLSKLIIASRIDVLEKITGKQ